MAAAQPDGFADTIARMMLPTTNQRPAATAVGHDIPASQASELSRHIARSAQVGVMTVCKALGFLSPTRGGSFHLEVDLFDEKVGVQLLRNARIQVELPLLVLASTDDDTAAIVHYQNAPLAALTQEVSAEIKTESSANPQTVMLSTGAYPDWWVYYGQLQTPESRKACGAGMTLEDLMAWTSETQRPYIDLEIPPMFTWPGMKLIVTIQLRPLHDVIKFRAWRVNDDNAVIAAQADTGFYMPALPTTGLTSYGTTDFNAAGVRTVGLIPEGKVRVDLLVEFATISGAAPVREDQVFQRVRHIGKVKASTRVLDVSVDSAALRAGGCTSEMCTSNGTVFGALRSVSMIASHAIARTFTYGLSFDGCGFGYYSLFQDGGVPTATVDLDPTFELYLFGKSARSTGFSDAFAGMFGVPIGICPLTVDTIASRFSDGYTRFPPIKTVAISHRGSAGQVLSSAQLERDDVTGMLTVRMAGTEHSGIPVSLARDMSINLTLDGRIQPPTDLYPSVVTVPNARNSHQDVDVMVCLNEIRRLTVGPRDGIKVEPIKVLCADPKREFCS